MAQVEPFFTKNQQLRGKKLAHVSRSAQRPRFIRSFKTRAFAPLRQAGGDSVARV
jgi:hypothetical protein